MMLYSYAICVCFLVYVIVLIVLWWGNGGGALWSQHYLETSSVDLCCKHWKPVIMFIMCKMYNHTIFLYSVQNVSYSNFSFTVRALFDSSEIEDFLCSWPVWAESCTLTCTRIHILCYYILLIITPLATCSFSFYFLHVSKQDKKFRHVYSNEFEIYWELHCISYIWTFKTSNFNLDPNM